jgi:hypothetical protein
MNIRRSIGDETFDMGPGANIWMAAEFGSRVGVGVMVSGLGNVGSGDGEEAISVNVAEGSGVDDGIIDGLMSGGEGMTNTV